MVLARKLELKEPPWPSHTPKKLHAGRPGTGQLTRILQAQRNRRKKKT
jgi:hypothetical protein